MLRVSFMHQFGRGKLGDLVSLLSSRDFIERTHKEEIFAYTLFLILQNSGDVPKTEIKRYIQKWFVLSTLTGRYVSSPESQMDRDLRSINAKGFLDFFRENEEAMLSDTFWSVRLVRCRTWKPHP